MANTFRHPIPDKVLANLDDELRDSKNYAARVVNIARIMEQAKNHIIFEGTTYLTTLTQIKKDPWDHNTDQLQFWIDPQNRFDSKAEMIISQLRSELVDVRSDFNLVVIGEDSYIAATATTDENRKWISTTDWFIYEM